MSRVVVNLSWMVHGSVGGSEEYTSRLLGAVSRYPSSGIDVELVGMSGLGESHPELAAAFPMRCAPFGGAFRPLRIASENTWMRGKCRGADLVHHFGGHIPARHAAPAAVTIHDTQPLDNPANFSKAKQIYMRRMIPHAVDAADLICTPSRWVADRVRDHFPRMKAEVRVVPSTWDGGDGDIDATEAITNDFPGLPDLTDMQVILYPAVTHRHKNHTVLLHAVSLLKDKRPSIRLVLTGGAGLAHRDVVDLIQQLGISDVVTHAGRLPAADLARLLRRADVLAFPSRYEGFGLPVLEAMRCATPVVAAATTALPEVLADAGTLIDPDDPDMWAQALEAALDRGPEIERLVEAGTNRCEEYRPSRSAGRLTDAWREVIG